MSNIIIGNHNVFSAGGSEEHARTLAAEFTRRGDDARLWGPIARFPKHDGPAFLSHVHIVCSYLLDNPGSRCIQTVHGLVPTLESPVREPRVKHVAVSLEIAEAYPDLKMPVIPNGVDLNRFRPSHPLPDSPTRLLCAAQNEALAGRISKICQKRGIEFRAKNKFINPTMTIEDDMKWADVVVAIGRTAIEAAACGKVVILADHRPYQDAMGDGVLTLHEHERIMRTNYSGRCFRMPVTDEWLEAQLDLYHPKWGAHGRYIATHFHDVRKQADAYMAVWEEWAC